MDLVDINDVKFGDRPDSKEAIERKIKDLEEEAANICNYIHVLHPASAEEAGRALKQYAI